MLSVNEIINHPSLQDTDLLGTFKEFPLGFIDIGARGGVHDLVEPFAKRTSVLAFEPDKDECQRLLSIPEVVNQWAEFIIEPIALSNKKGQAELVLMSAPTNHSLREPNLLVTDRYNMEKWREVGRESLQTDTLDNIIDCRFSNQKYIGEFIKLDTQGSEYEILQGAFNTITTRTVAIVCEVSFAELYKGQKLFSEVEILMRDFGFSFYGFTSMFSRSQKQLDKLSHGSKERPFYTDAIFFRDPIQGTAVSQSFSKRQAKSLFICTILLGYFDFALELAKKTWLVDASLDENKKIVDFVLDISKQPIENEKINVFDLYDKIKKSPDLTNLHIGAFVDQRRENNDFHDVLNTLATPIPK